MSCSLITKEDWLDNNFSSHTSKFIFILMAVLGGVLLYFQIKLQENCNQTDTSLPILFRILQFTSIFILILSLIMLVVAWKTSIDFSGSLLKFGVIIIILTTLLILALTIGISIELNKLNCTMDNYMWIPVGIMVFISIILGYYAFKTQVSFTNISSDKDIRWENVSMNADLIEKIGQTQAKQCNIKLEEGESVASFNNYLKERQDKFKSENNFFTRTFKSPPKLPGDKIPNIIKMNHRMVGSATSYEKFKMFEETIKKQQYNRSSQNNSSLDSSSLNSVFNNLSSTAKSLMS